MIRLIRNFFLFLSVFCLISVLGSCSLITDGEIPGHGPETSPVAEAEFKSDPELFHGTLPNGFNYYLYRNSTPENRVSIHLDVLAGSFHEKDSEQGIAHYLEHMLFNGSTHFKPGELIEYFQSIGMDFGADANAHTGFFETVYDLSLPDGRKKSIEDALTVIDDYARGALLLETEIERERGIILAEKRDRDSVSYRTFKSSMEFELPGSRLTKRYPIGIKKVIETADRPIFKEFYDNWYRPDNMNLVLVGDFDLTVVQDLIKRKFSDLKTRGEKVFVPENSWTDHKGIKSFYHFEPEAGSTDITIETVSRVDFKAQSLNDLKTEVKNNIGNSILNNRLSRLLVQKDPPFSDIGTYSGVYLRNISFSSISAETTEKNWKETLYILETNLRKALHFGFTQKELERAKIEFINYLENAVKTSSTRETESIASRILYHINNKKVFLSPESKLKVLKPFIESLNLQDINKSFINTWKADHRLVMVTGNAEIGRDKKEAETLILSEYNNSRKRIVKAHQDTEDIIFPYLPELIQKSKEQVPGNPELLKEKKEIQGLDITTIEYKNNIRLNLKKTDFKKGEFIFNASVKGGSISEPMIRPGLSVITEDLVNESGLGGADKEGLREILSGTNVDIDFEIEDEYFTFRGQGEPSEIKLVFELIYSFLYDPAFRKESLALVKQRYRQDFSSLLRTPEGLMYIKGDRFLAGGDKRFGLPDIDRVNEFTLTDIKNWLIPCLQNSALEISIAGDFSLEDAERLAEIYFGSLPERNSAEPVKISDNILNFPSGNTLELEVDTRVDKSEIRLAFLTDDFWNISQTRALNILSRIISERFRISIREERGLAYSAYAYNDPSLVYDNYGILHSIVYGKPSEIETILKIMKDITDDIAESGVTQREIDLVKKPVLNHIKDMQRTNAYWLNSVMAGSFFHPDKLEWAKTMADEYSSVSKARVSSLAEKYLVPDKSAVVIIRPALKTD